MEELISIIIPVYNTEPYIYCCLNSVINQTYENIEVVVVNDGTMDNSLRIVKGFAKSDKRIKVYSQKNRGLSAARNTGLNKAKGEYIFFLDSDDAIHKQTIEIMYNLLVREKVDIVACDLLKCVESPKDFPVRNVKFEVADRNSAFNNLFCENSNGSKSRVSCAKLFKKDIFRKIEFPVGRFHEDEYVIHQIVGRIEKICYCFIPLYYYFENPRSIMHCFTLQRAFDAIGAYYNRLFFFVEYKNEEFIIKAAIQYLEAVIDNYFCLRKIGLLTHELKKMLIIEYEKGLMLMQKGLRFRYICFKYSPKCYYYIFRIPERIFLRIKNHWRKYNAR